MPLPEGPSSPIRIFSALTSALSSTSEQLGQHEALVVLTGGTPESLIAGIAAGFKNIIYVTNDDREVDMMTLPLDSSDIDFERFGLPVSNKLDPNHQKRITCLSVNFNLD